MHSTSSKAPSLMSVRQVADMLNISTKTVRRMIGDDRLRHHRVGHIVRVSHEDLRAYLNSVRQ